MFLRVCSAMVLLTGVCGTAVAETKRQLKAHEHGHGSLQIGIDGQKLVMELEVPGADIVGFEHAARTDKEKAAIRNAKDALAGATSLFKLPEGAGCRLEEAKVALSGEEHGHEKEHVSGKEAGHGHGEKHGAEHAEFLAGYSFRCASLDALNSISFPYFEKFPGAEELDVTLVTDKGQKEFEVNRKNRQIDLQGMM